MKHSVYTVSILFLAVYAYSGTCEVSPDFRLGSGAGATYSDSHSHTSNPQPRSNTNSSMPLVAFAFIMTLVIASLLQLAWTYLVSWKGTSWFWERCLSGEIMYIKVEVAHTKYHFGKPKQSRGIPGRRWILRLKYIVLATSLVESETLSAEITPLRTTNPIQPLLHLSLIHI